MQKTPPLSPELVREFVSKSHGDYDGVVELLASHPTLVNAAWDWGGGDWETGLGAAAHTGSRSIAEHLLARGARLDLFAAAMLGKLALVQAMMADNPALKCALGPHGIPLLVHAQFGGEPAAEVLTYLESL